MTGLRANSCEKYNPVELFAPSDGKGEMLGQDYRINRKKSKPLPENRIFRENPLLSIL